MVSADSLGPHKRLVAGCELQAEDKEISVGCLKRAKIVVVRQAKMPAVPGFFLIARDTEVLIVKCALARDELFFGYEVMIAGDGAIWDNSVENPRGLPGVLPFRLYVSVLHDIAEADHELNVVGLYPLANPHRLSDIGLRVFFAVELRIGQEHDGEDFICAGCLRI